MDGSVSTLAPVFAARLCHAHEQGCLPRWHGGLCGSRTSIGFAEAMSDDGVRRLQCAPRIRATPFSLSVPASMRRSNNGPLQPADDGLGKLPGRRRAAQVGGAHLILVQRLVDRLAQLMRKL